MWRDMQIEPLGAATSNTQSTRLVESHTHTHTHTHTRSQTHTNTRILTVRFDVCQKKKQKKHKLIASCEVGKYGIAISAYPYWSWHYTYVSTVHKLGTYTNVRSQIYLLMNKSMLVVWLLKIVKITPSSILSFIFLSETYRSKRIVICVSFFRRIPWYGTTVNGFRL